MMKNIVLILTSIVLMLSLFSCNKIEIPEPEDNLQVTPSLDFQMNLGDKQLNFAAGTDCYKLISNYNLDHLGVYSFWGAFTFDENCQEELNEESFKIEIRDQEIRNSTSEIQLDAIDISSYEYFNGYNEVIGTAIDLYVFPFFGEDLIISTSSEMILELDEFTNHLNTILPLEEEWILIEYIINGELLASRKYYLLDKFDAPLFSEVFIIKDSVDEGIILNTSFFEPLPGTFEYLWDDGSTEPFLLVKYEDVLPDCFHKYCVSIFKDGELVVEDCVSISFDFFFDHQFNSIYSNLTTEIVSGGSEALKTVLIEYTDEDGNVYNSIGQNASSSFEVQNIEPFINNPDGLKSSKLEVTMNCWLQSVDGLEQIFLENASGTIAVSYPE